MPYVALNELSVHSRYRGLVLGGIFGADAAVTRAFIVSKESERRPSIISRIGNRLFDVTTEITSLLKLICASCRSADVAMYRETVRSTHAASTITSRTVDSGSNCYIVLL